MSKTAQPATKPTATTGGKSTTAVTDANPKRDFFVAAANMSWQLAIVVLVPLLVGSKLDQQFDTSPALTLLGFVVAMAGMGVVMWYQLKRLSPPATGAKK